VQTSDDNKLVLNGKIANLQKKWNDYCHRLHTSYSPRIVASENNYSLIPGIAPVTQSPAMVTLPKPNRPIQSISLPSSTNLGDEDLISKLQPRNSKSEQLHLDGSEGHASPSSATSVTTDLALATPQGPPPNKTEIPKARSPSQLNLNANPVTSRDLCIPDVNSYKSFLADLYKRVGRQEEALKHISSVISSRVNPSIVPGLSRRGIWLGFQGGDQVAQKRVAAALAEMVSGRIDNLVSVDLSKSDLSMCFNARHHGMTSIDYIASEIARKPSAVVYIENVDKADFLEQKSLNNAVNNGKLLDSSNREIGIGGRIFLLSAGRKTILSPSKKYSNFAEANILSAQSRKMKIVMDSANALIGNSSSGRVVLTRRCDSAKRKSGTCYGSPKRPHLGLDLNLSIEESKDEPENNSASEDDFDTWVEELFEKLDQKVEFSAFNYNALADEVLWNVNGIFCEKFGPGSCQLEIEMDVMEQILAVEERRTIHKWVETVLRASFGELKQRCTRLLGSGVFRLVACEKEPLREGESLAVSPLLPCKIIIN
jgi:hypothetical protein